MHSLCSLGDLDMTGTSEPSGGKEVTPGHVTALNSLTPECTKVTPGGGHVTWSCDLCIMEFPTQDNLERHKDTAHKVRDNKTYTRA